MSADAPSTANRAPGRPCWPWIALVLALGWEGIVRAPLILNAATHLDSDLAVDGLTLLEATRGHWRWHYPGTPAIGTIPVLLSLPQALVWGANPISLVSGGTVAYLLLTVAVFLLAWRAFGPAVASWSLLPLAFASTGALWLSGRITGGHLLAAAWHAGAFALLHGAIARGGMRRAAGLGLWCGLGVYLDAMFAITLAGLAAAGLVASLRSRPSRQALGWALAGLLAFLAGALPRELGRRLEPHDAYREQFRLVRDPRILEAHAEMLVLQCLPRLIVGHRLPGLQADPDPRALAGPGPTSRTPDDHPAAWGLTALGLVLFALALLALIRARGPAAAAPVRIGLLVSAASVAAGFVTSWNIYNSDNYRYLVTLLVPWALGFGLLMDALARRGPGGLAAALLCAILLAGLMSFDTARWYARFGWIDARGLPRRIPVDDPALDWLEAHPEVSFIRGDYWDVYRLAFLTGGRVRGVPLPIFPDRFPEWSRATTGGEPDALILRGGRQGQLFLESALAGGGRILLERRGLIIVSQPRGRAWGEP